MNEKPLLLVNAKILTTDENRSSAAQAMAIRDGKILTVGSNREVSEQVGDQAQVIDMGGKVLWPGLADAHIHMELYSQGLKRVDCETPTLNECLQRIGERARKTPPGEWILGHGWNQNEWPEGFGTAAMLDLAAPHNPVYLSAKSVHAAWANTQALQAAGIQPVSPDPDGGSFQRDARGKLTGILFEKAMQLVEKVLPVPTDRDLAETLYNAQSILWRMGITSVHDFDPRRSFSAFQILDGQNRLRLRVLKSISRESLQGAIDAGLRTGFGSEYLKIGSLKLFADGALGPQTAAMIEPYATSADQYGMLFLDEEDVLEIGREAVSHGISLAIHAIGDKAVHSVLNGYEALRDYEHANHFPHARHRIEHVQLLHPADVSRLGQLGVIASMQPLHATSDMLIADRFWGSRSANAYALRTVLSHQTTLAFGSDAPVESPNPFWGMHAAVTRQRRDGTPGRLGWYPEQRLTLAEALHGYTTGPAYAAGLEKSIGRLSPGYAADIIVLDEDPFTVEPEGLADITPVGTMVGGEWVWEADPR